MRKICGILSLILILMMITSCSTSRLMFWKGESTNVHIGLSEEYDPKLHNSIALLPFKNIGIRGTDPVIVVKFAVHLMEQGFELADHQLVNKLLKQTGADPEKELSLDNLKQIQSGAGVSMVGTGESIYGLDKNDEMVLQAVSIRLLDAGTGKIIISGYATGITEKTSASLEISKEIGKKIRMVADEMAAQGM